VRNIRAREGVEEEELNGDTEIEDLDHQLIRLIGSNPPTSHRLPRPPVGSRSVSFVHALVPTRKDFDYHDDYEEDCSEHFHQERPKCTCSQLVNISSGAFKH